MERLVLTGLFLFWGGVSCSGVPPPLSCPLLDERGSVSPRPARIRIWGGSQSPPDPQTPPDSEGTFHVTDPWGSLGSFWGPPWDPLPKCELSPTAPLLPPLGPPGTSPKCPQAQGEPWWLLALGTPGTEGTALLRGHPPRANVSLAISTRTPTLQGVSGTPQTLHCSFSPHPALDPSGSPFTLEWLHHRGGVTRRLLAFHSSSSSVSEAAPGVLLLLGDRDSPPNSGGAAGAEVSGGSLEVSLQLPPLQTSDRGSFVCSVATPHGQVQQVLKMHVIAPPQVTLVPDPPVLLPGVPVELRCNAVGFFPLDVGIRWELQAGGSPTSLDVTSEATWSSGHRRAADGTYSRSAGLRVTRGTPGDRYSCVVTHEAWQEPRRVTVTLEVAGATGPSLEDMAGLALMAFVIGGLCLRLKPPAGR